MNQYYDINEEPQRQGEEPQEQDFPQQQNEIQDIENTNDQYCCGLLSRSDHIIIKVLKLIIAIPLLPLVLIWKIIQFAIIQLYEFCSNQIYHCLVQVCGKFVQCLQFLWLYFSIICNYIYSCLTYICQKLLDAIYFLGRCSKCILDWYSIFIINMIFKFAHFKSMIQEFTSFITIPLSLKIIIPLSMCFYHNIYIPTKTAIIFIIETLYQVIKLIILTFYNFTVDYILKPFYQYIILNFLKFIKFLFVDIFFDIIIVNFYKGMMWSISYFYTFILVNFYKYFIVKFLYEIVLTYSCKAIMFIFYDFLFKLIIIPLSKAIRWIIIDFLYLIVIEKLWQFLRFVIVNVTKFIYFQVCVNLYRCVSWVIINIIYQLILRNLFLYILKPLYNILVSTIKIILISFYRFLLQPLWNFSKYLFNGLISIISIIVSFIYYQLLNPIWNFIVILTVGMIDLLKRLFTAGRQLSIDLWNAIINLFRRLRNII